MGKLEQVNLLLEWGHGAVVKMWESNLETLRNPDPAAKLFYAFTWGNSPEGYAFWFTVNSALLYNRPESMPEYCTSKLSTRWK